MLLGVVPPVIAVVVVHSIMIDPTSVTVSMGTHIAHGMTVLIAVGIHFHGLWFRGFDFAHFPHHGDAARTAGYDVEEREGDVFVSEGNESESAGALRPAI
jgi:hypothetical protein